jgi:hypothetical protein
VGLGKSKNKIEITPQRAGASRNVSQTYRVARFREIAIVFWSYPAEIGW